MNEPNRDDELGGTEEIDLNEEEEEALEQAWDNLDEEEESSREEPSVPLSPFLDRVKRIQQ